MRKKIVAGNWKMNGTKKSAVDLFNDINKGLSNEEVEVIVLPPSIYLDKLISLNKEKKIKIGCQNFYPQEKGAFTGEISISQLKDLGLDYALVGHSERRDYFGENSIFIKKKINSLLQNNILPIFCCGESLESRENKKYKEFVGSQIEESLFHLTKEEFKKVVIAYEPIWAIGTGKTASSNQAEEMHKFIRDLIKVKYGLEVSKNLSILYGGSCKPSNSVELFENHNIDGGLIGGASLKASSFLEIINSF